VDPETGTPLPDGKVGEIVVVGPHVCDGYWGHPTSQQATFASDGLHTGDLGSLVDGELYVTGRRKDMLILRGQNIYPQDIEMTMERAHPAVRPGCGIATSVSTESDEHLVLVQEVKPDALPEPEAVVEAIKRLVVEEHGVRPDAIVLIAPRTIQKTTSGKLRRSATAEAFRGSTLDVVHQWVGTSLS
jgi:acyl-CoA synthetase (AMP-forming)/AMP-acid ligase II